MKRFGIWMLTAASAVAVGMAADGPRNPFFVFDNGTGRDRKLPLEQQADMVQRAGYAGIGFTGTQRIPELLEILDARGLKLFSIYVAAHVDRDKPEFDSDLPQAIRQLKGRNTAIWLTIQGKAADGDARAAGIVRELADLAAVSGLRVVIYPHAGFYAQRIEDALRIRALAGRPNVGVTFNLAHFLAIGDEPNLDRQLSDAMPFLDMVSINGADHEGNWRSGDWSRLIQTLDRGQFDVRGLLQKLRRLSYKGPIGLQCFQVAGDIEENLRRSMAAWRAMEVDQ
jgi:sugar phosphate isomerase/epimerase